MAKKPAFRKSGLPWYIFDDTNMILITSPTIPVSISDAKDIIWAEPNIPGLNFTPLYPNRNGNTKISFSLPIIMRKGKTGNSNLLQSFELLRNNDTPSLSSLFSRGSQFSANPSVIYSWGTHRLPQRYKMTSLKFEHNGILTNKFGVSQYSVVNMELALDEQSALYRADRVARKVQAIMGTVQATRQLYQKSGRAY